MLSATCFCNAAWTFGVPTQAQGALNLRNRGLRRFHVALHCARARAMARQPTVAPTAGTDASADEAKPARNLGPLAMIWRLAAHYPKQVVIALLALLTTSSATIAIPMRFKLIVDKAFGSGAHSADIAHVFESLLAIVLVLGLATAVRFYYVSWLGER